MHPSQSNLSCFCGLRLQFCSCLLVVLPMMVWPGHHQGFHSPGHTHFQVHNVFLTIKQRPILIADLIKHHGNDPIGPLQIHCPHSEPHDVGMWRTWRCLDLSKGVLAISQDLLSHDTGPHTPLNYTLNLSGSPGHGWLESMCPTAVAVALLCHHQ